MKVAVVIAFLVVICAVVQGQLPIPDSNTVPVQTLGGSGDDASSSETVNTGDRQGVPIGNNGDSSTNTGGSNPAIPSQGPISNNAASTSSPVNTPSGKQPPTGVKKP